MAEDRRTTLVTVDRARAGHLNDAALLEAAYAGDEAAFEQLFVRHYRKVFGVAARIVGSPEDAEEIALDAFLRLSERRLRIVDGDRVAGWLYRTTTNAAFNAVRSRNRRLKWLRAFAVRKQPEFRESDDPAAEVEREEMAKIVRKALKELPDRQRNALVMRASGLSYREIAAALDMSPGSVGTTLARAEFRLREVIEQGSKA